MIKITTIKKVHNTRSENSKEYWETPKYFFELLDKLFHFTLDPCADSKNRKCKRFYSKEVNGLVQDWRGETVFVNPPYSDKKNWLRKAYIEGLKESTKVVVLIPAITETKFFRNFCWKAKKIMLVQGRIEFEINGKKVGNGNTKGSMLIVFDGQNKRKPGFDLFYHKEKDLIEQESCIERYL